LLERARLIVARRHLPRRAAQMNLVDQCERTLRAAGWLS
jgi:hypothetical protein